MAAGAGIGRRSFAVAAGSRGASGDADPYSLYGNTA